jgi:polyhydroxybutyrate depolymerase
MVRSTLALPLVAMTMACSSPSAAPHVTAAEAAAETSVDAGAGVRGAYDPKPFGGARPVELYIPSKYAPATPTPLIILLHGYGATGAEEDLFLGLRGVAETDTVLYAHPDGTKDTHGNEFWNATNACCDFYFAKVDDSMYLSSLIVEFGTRYNVDPKRVYFIGHSNGGFMSYRMACDHADQVAGIVSIEGATWLDTSECKPSVPVAALEVHGTSDDVVFYDGGNTDTDTIFDGGTIDGGGVYPGAITTVGDWASYDGCKAPANTSLPNLDIAAGLVTSATQYETGCRASTQVDLWTIHGGMHIPAFNLSFAPMAFQFLLSHPRP